MKEIGPRLSIATEMLRRWVEQAEVDASDKPGVTTSAASGHAGSFRRKVREDRKGAA